jgi:hypothetical protein
MTAPARKKPGPKGPRLPADETRCETIRLRATQSEKALFERLGGPEWLRDLLAVEQRKLERLERS